MVQQLKSIRGTAGVLASVLVAAWWPASAQDRPASGAPARARPSLERAQGAVSPQAGKDSAGHEPIGDATAVAPGGDPFAAYEAGDFSSALEGFEERLQKHPEQPHFSLGKGSAQYQLGDYEGAAKQFDQVVAEGSSGRLRSAALYNKGNAAFRQGKLDEAVDAYLAALDADPADQDSRVNLELARRRLAAQQPQGQENGQPGESDQSSDSRDSEQGQEPKQDEGQSDAPNQPNAGSQQADSDGDGLSDELERYGQNPTDPGNPDSDGDGRPDGDEDRNRNGRVDSGESDPNLADQDDSSESSSSHPETKGAMSERDAERFLAALQEGRPQKERRGKVVRSAKDW